MLVRTASIVALLLVAGACGGGGGGGVGESTPSLDSSSAVDVVAPTAPPTSLSAAAPTDAPPVDESVPVGIWIDTVNRSVPVPDGTTSVVAIQVGSAAPGSSGRIEVTMPADGSDEQSGVAGGCAGLPTGDLGGATVIAIDARKEGADEGLVGAQLTILDEAIVPGALHAASLQWATSDGVVRSGAGDVRLAADARSGTFIGRDTTDAVVTGRFDCFAEGGVTNTAVATSVRDLRSIEITADLEGDDWVEGVRLEADAASLEGIEPARDGSAYCSGVVGLDEPYLVLLTSAAASDRETLVSVELLASRPAAQRERVDATLVLETDGDRYVFEEAVMELSSDGTGGYFEGTAPGGEQVSVTGFWLCE